MQHAGSLVAACELLVAACMRDLVPRLGIEPRPPVLKAWSLTHWTTREVPRATILELRKSLWGDTVEPFPSWKEFLTNRANGFSSLPSSQENKQASSRSEVRETFPTGLLWASSALILRKFLLLIGGPQG